MSSYPVWDDTDADPLTEELDDAEGFGVSERRGRCPGPCVSCFCFTKTKARRNACISLIVLMLLLVAGGGTALGLYFNGFFIPTCQRLSAFTFYDALGNFSYSVEDEPIYFKQEWNSCNASINSSMDIPLDGIYFLELTVGTQQQNEITFSVLDKSDGTTASVSRKSTAHNASDIISKSAIVTLGEHHHLYATQKGTLYDDERFLMTAWSGFRMTDMFSPLHVFSSFLPSSQADLGAIMFDNVNLGIDGESPYNETNGAFSAPIDGVYFFTFSTGVPANSTQKVAINVNNDTMAVLNRADNFTNDVDALSRSVLVELEKGDDVTLELEGGELYSSELGMETTFSGFLYSPKNAPQHCWSVFLDHNWATDKNGTLDPVPLRNVTIDKGDLFRADNSTIILKETGLYYVYASVGLQPSHKVYVHIMHNDRNIGSVARFEGYQGGEDQMGRGVLVHADAGDTFHLWEDECPGCAILADGKHKQTTFVGLLLNTD